MFARLAIGLHRPGAASKPDGSRRRFAGRVGNSLSEPDLQIELHVPLVEITPQILCPSDLSVAG
jgi:hypothetical protein